MLKNINPSFANPGLLIFLIYLPIILFLINKNFRQRFTKLHSANFGFLLEAFVGIMYFIIIIYSATLSFTKLVPATIGFLIYLIGLIITFSGYLAFFIVKSEIITKFPYNISRNPTYLFAFIAIAGIAIATTSELLILFLIIQFALTHKIILNEQKYLLKTFPKQYKLYLARVPQYI